ncbi:MAG: hypothetical protein Q7K21_04695 [Elusimicrobiota bacterium]|nr:hypothetical protein [Elusimicrobiota bacterium]
MTTKEKGYIVYLAMDCRRRHYSKCIGKWVVEFCVQLELFTDSKWFPVIRYDTAHGFAHRDYIRHDGRIEKTPINIEGFNEALTFSENDIKVNWELYREKFLKEKGETNDR